MPRNITVTLGDGSTHTYQNAPDNITPEMVQARAQKEFGQSVSHIDGGSGGVPSGSESIQSNNDVSQITQPLQAQPQQPEASLMDKIVGAGETGLAALTGATGGTIGNIIGSIKGIGESIGSGKFGTQEGADLASQEAAKFAKRFTYEPTSQSGKEMTQALGEVSEPLAGLAPFTQELGAIGQGVRNAAPIARGAIAGEAELLKPKPSTKQLDIVKKIQEGSTENDLAPYKIEVSNPRLRDRSGKLLPEAYKVVDDDAAKSAIGQDWEQGTVQAAKNFDPKTADVAKRMMDVAMRGTKDDTYKANNRPISEIGDELAAQLNHIRSVNRESGAAINRAAENLKGERVDVAPAVDRFITSLSDDLGVTVSPSKKGVVIDFAGSFLEGNTTELRSAQGVVKNLVNRMYNTRTPSAYDVHRLKGYIDTQASYGSQLGGLKGKADRIVKNLRHDLDTVLDDNFPEYNQANTVFAETKTALDNMQELVGKKVDLRANSSAQALGRISRRILSNAQSAERVREAALNINDVATRYGAKSSGDIPALVKFADTIDKQFGIAADTSLASEVAKGVMQSKKEAAINVGTALYQKAKGVNNDKKYKTMSELLNRQIRGKK